MYYSMGMQHFRDARRVMAESTAICSTFTRLSKLGKMEHHQRLIWHSWAIKAPIFQHFIYWYLSLKTNVINQDHPIYASAVTAVTTLLTNDSQEIRLLPRLLFSTDLNAPQMHIIKNVYEILLNYCKWLLISNTKNRNINICSYKKLWIFPFGHSNNSISEKP